VRDDDARVLNYINGNIKKLLSEDADVSLEEARDVVFSQILSDSRTICPELASEIDNEVEAVILARSDRGRTVAEEIQQEHSKLFDRIERLIACAEQINRRLTARFADDKDLHKESLAKEGEDTVVGKTLQSLIMLSMHGRICMLATEVCLLLKNGFLEGATARMRTIYETTVVSAVIGQSAPEISERYQAYAVFERLAEIEAAENPEALLSVTFPLKDRQEARTVANWWIAKYGGEIKRPYEWARPLFPDRKGRIHFSDLDGLVLKSAMRGEYLAGNHGVHSGAYVAINQARFDGEHLFLTGPEKMYTEDLCYLIHVVSILVMAATDRTSRCLISILACLREIIGLGVLEELLFEITSELMRIQGDGTSERP